MQQSFFAYGSFCKNQVHYPKFSNLIQSEQKAFVRGNMFRLQCCYPILSTFGMNEDLIEGTLYELEVTESFWSILDQLLGVDKQQPGVWSRQQVPVLLDSFTRRESQVYTLNPEQMDQVQRPIQSGAWQEDMTKFPPLDRSLGQRHIDYIKKLSQARGREVVPYKLDVYRELLALEVIKDKGRRQALTPLGQELARFL